jgi:hypothetical protein
MSKPDVSKQEDQKFSTVPLDWKEVYYTNCPLVSASNVDQELGWGPEKSSRRSASSTLISSRCVKMISILTTSTISTTSFASAGLFSPVHVHADIRRIRRLGATHVYEGGCMMVRARDDIYRIKDLKGKNIGLTKSLNTIKNDWWRIQEEQGIELMLMLNDMTRDDVEIVEFSYPDN